MSLLIRSFYNIGHNGRYYQQLAISGRCTLLLNQIFKRERTLLNANKQPNADS